VAIVAYIIAWIVIPEEPEIVYTTHPTMVQSPQG
jgi:hypothetical protein